MSLKQANKKIYDIEASAITFTQMMMLVTLNIVFITKNKHHLFFYY